MLSLIISATVFLFFLSSFRKKLEFFNLVVFKVLLEEILKLRPHHQVFGFKVTLMLMLLLNYCFAEKQGSKKDAVGPVGPSSFEMIFTLLVKAVTVQV